MPVKIMIDPNQCAAKVQTAWEKGLYELSSEILADCNQYVKRDHGILEGESNTQSIPEKGILVWDQVYAKRQYWEIKTSLTPGRTWKWCETAKRKWKTRWQQLAEEGMKKNL